MLDLNKPVQTRDGRPARIICADRKTTLDGLALVTLVMDQGSEHIYHHSSKGKLWGSVEESRSDLVNVPVQEVRFRAVYGDGSASSMWYKTIVEMDRVCLSRVGHLVVKTVGGVLKDIEYVRR